MRASLRLIFAVVLVCSGLAWPSSVRQEQAPPATSPDQNTQDQRQPSANPPAQSAPPAANNPAAPTTITGEKPSATPKPPVLKHRKRKAHHSSSARKKTPATSNGDSSKVVVRNGGAKEGSAQLAPAVNPAQANKQRANTNSLLAATDANLKRIAGRQLTPAQQSMVDEINTYMRQAKAAASSADTNRAQTLAYKARLLSEELARK